MKVVSNATTIRLASNGMSTHCKVTEVNQSFLFYLSRSLIEILRENSIEKCCNRLRLQQISQLSVTF